MFMSVMQLPEGAIPISELRFPLPFTSVRVCVRLIANKYFLHVS